MVLIGSVSELESTHNENCPQVVTKTLILEKQVPRLFFSFLFSSFFLVFFFLLHFSENSWSSKSSIHLYCVGAEVEILNKTSSIDRYNYSSMRYFFAM